METIVIRNKKTAYQLSAAIMVVLPFIIAAAIEAENVRENPFDVVVIAATFILGIYFWPLAYRLFKKSRDDSPQLIVDDIGVHECREVYGKMTIPWNNIRKVRLRDSYFGAPGPSVCLEVMSKENYPAKQRRWWQSRYENPLFAKTLSNQNEISLPLGMFDLQHKQIEKLIAERLRKAAEVATR